jgi:1-acyl-sn-glycerol-3-phosphate acyltransferase
MQAIALYSYAEFGVVASSYLPMVMLARAWEGRDPTHRLPGRVLRSMARTIVAGSPLWRFSVAGTPPPDIRNRPHVVVANHASLADPFLLSQLPWDMRFVAKEELFKLPLVGWLLKLGGDIPVRRGDRQSAQDMLDACRATLARGLSIMMFPEGTRARSGELGHFKTGAFQVAVAQHAPILPVALHGTQGCVGKGGLSRASAYAEILAPIETRDCDPRDVHALAELTRGRIAAALALPPAARLHAASAADGGYLGEDRRASRSSAMCS